MGNFRKFLATNLVTKIAQIFSDFLGYFEKAHIESKTDLATFVHLSENIGLLFISTSGHTVHASNRIKPGKS